jgi:hypothetical protein
MFIINDIELLQRLSKYKILNHLTARCVISISGIRLNDYSLRVRQFVENVNEISVLHIEKDGFDDWIVGKRKHLSISELSTIYVALCNKGAILVLSEEDQLLIPELKKNRINYLEFDEFMIKQIQDEQLIQLYNVIKAA